MSEADKILKMIESVNPSDTATMDEIDARVWAFWNKIPCSDKMFGLVPMFSRSRDALKGIRPKGWHLTINECSNGGGFIIGWVCQLTNFDEETIFQNKKCLRTEELAELHAIIQAIEYERKNIE